MSHTDESSLERFVVAQARVFDDVMAELRSGRKRSHWMWFIFPQLRGLGQSATARFYGLASRDEACAYLAHPVLGPRLHAATRAVLGIEGPSLHDIFGSPDDLKFCSCMTLFTRVAGDKIDVFRLALDRYCAGRMDERTLALLGDATNSGG